MIAGVMLAVRRRMREEGAAAVQRFAEDFMPLILLFAVSLTGLMLTASYTWMKGYAYTFIAILHAITVIGTFLWLPFGKFFHIFQRPAQLGVGFYKDVGRAQELAHCRRCGHAFSSRMHIEDLIEVERQLGFHYDIPGDDGHYQWICPRCRRASLAMAQGALWRGERGGAPLPDGRPLPMPVHANPARGPGAARCSKTPTISSRSRPSPHHRSTQTMNGPARTTETTPSLDRETIGEFGPHLAYARDSRLDTGVEPDKLRQDALLLLRPAVRDAAQGQGQPGHRRRAVVRVPLQQGDDVSRRASSATCSRRIPIACSMPTRRTPARPAASGRWPTTTAIRRTAGEIERIQRDPRQGRVRLLSGASLTTEKTYLMGKFAHMCLRTANIDYNGRLCMVSAAAGNKKAFGIDRAANPWERHPRRRRDPGQRRQHRRVRADHDQLRLAGPRAGRQGHRRRSAHHADRADLRSVPAGQAGPRHRALQRHPAPDDRARLARSRVHREPHGRASRRSRQHVREWTPQRTAEVTGIAEKSIRAGRRMVGHGEDELPAATRAASSTTATA